MPADFKPDRPINGAKWQTVDIRFDGPKNLGDPFDIEFLATFSGPKQASVSIPGFFDGGNSFVVRFSPPDEGTWKFETASPIAMLNGLRGTVIAAAAGANERGPVMVDAEAPTRFRHADGSSYLPIAFEVDWLFAIDGENPNGIPKTEALIHHVAESGFNQVVMNVFAYDVQWDRAKNLDPRYDYGKPRIYPFGATNSAPDHTTLSIEYFKRFDRVIEHLDRNGIISHLMIYVWNKQVNWPEARSIEDNRYFDYVVKRYQAFPNIIWDISKEATGYGHNDKSYITDRIDRLRALDGHGRLVTVHDYGYCSQFPEKIDFISIQNWQSETWHVMREVRAKHPDKPIFNIEHGGYERGPYHVFTGNYLSPEVCLERAYQIVFAGAFPTHYWQDTSWNVVIHDIASLPEADQPKLAYYRHLADLAERYQFTQLTAGQQYANSGFCLSNQKDFFVFLVPRENDFIMVRPPPHRTGRMHATWFDPFTGASQDEPVRTIKDYNTFENPSPGQMSVLVVRTTPE